MNAVLAQIVESISPASIAQATGATQAFLRSGLAEEHGGLAEVATRLCAARHAPNPGVERKSVVVLASDHGVASPGIDLGENNPTALALRHIASGNAAINAAARSADASLVLVDTGIKGGDALDLGTGVLSFRIRNGSDNFCTGKAMSRDETEAGLQTGIALTFSLADAGLDLLALGQVSAGSQPTSAALVAALTGASAKSLSAADADVVEVGIARHLLRGRRERDASALIEVLACLGGPDVAVMAGMMLAAASINVPVVLDGHATSAAALWAHALCPQLRGYLFASHAGGIRAHAKALEAMELAPLFAVGLAQGEGTGAALALPMLDAAARAVRDARSAPTSA